MSYPFLAIDLALILVLLILFRKRSRPPEASTEYWVYLGKDKLPSHGAILRHLMMRGIVSNEEAMLLNDIRLNMILVLASKNPHLFQPYQLEESEPVGDPLWLSCAGASAMAMVRFAQADPATDRRYLDFLPQLAFTIAILSKGVAIFDVSQRKLISIDDFKKLTNGSENLQEPEAHVRVHWQEFPNIEAHTWGLSKIGLRELTTGQIDRDLRVLASDLLEKTVQSVWKTRDFKDTITLQEYGVDYRVAPANKGKKLERGRVKIQIFRVNRP